VGSHQWELGLAEDRRQTVARLVRETRRQLGDRRELVTLDELGLGRLEILELVPCRRVELRVLQRQPDLVGGGLDERDLRLAERFPRAAPERQRAKDSSPAVD